MQAKTGFFINRENEREKNMHERKMFRLHKQKRGEKQVFKLNIKILHKREKTAQLKPRHHHHVQNFFSKMYVK